MAKWGEGDERWIVTDRDDGANVNGWHWEEKERMHWIRERVPELLKGICAENPAEQARVRVKEVTSIDGEVCPQKVVFEPHVVFAYVVLHTRQSSACFAAL